MLGSRHGDGEFFDFSLFGAPGGRREVAKASEAIGRRLSRIESLIPPVEPVRDACSSEGIAIGSSAFVAKVKIALDIEAMDREVDQAGGTYAAATE